MFIALLMFLFTVLCVFLIIAVLIQQGKGDMGLGGLGGGSQMLFGGSGGQEFFQKITWVMGAIFIMGSLGLAILKSKHLETSRAKVTPASRQMTQPKQQQPSEQK
ncbi:preprotein translocase subunit SecG [Candidatus Babeliales bacterium]|nr:preprotein translocase subunit SecG [Candidatus Babeliales bacterium]MCF7899274.1 preprotein translocase subunit SecG [Candidatus Babeliales bacterium]